MSIYKSFIVGLDLSEDSSHILNKAKQLAANLDAKLIVCHVIESLAYAYGGDIPINLAEAQLTMEEHAQQRLNEILVENEMAEADHSIVVGETAAELRKIANDSNADLIIVGSHGRHGIALLLGSTASGVIHGAECDVLAVRV